MPREACRCHVVKSGFALALCALICFGGALAGADDYGSCQNPLFRQIWAGSDLAVAQARLNEKPVLRRDLRLCRQYNGRAACCGPDVEAQALEEAFEDWRRWLGAIAGTINGTEANLQALRRSWPDRFDRQDHVDYERFGIMLQRLGSLQEALPRCFDAILEYAAGMVCFACAPDWSNRGVLDVGAAVGQPPFRVRIPAYEARAVWAQCRDFSARSAAAIEAMRQAEYWARLAGIGQLEQMERRLAIFAGQQELQQGLYATIAAKPMYDGVRAHQATSVQEPSPGGDAAADALGVVSEGRRSGFDLRWPRPAAVALQV